MNTFPKGNDLIVKWAIQYSDGSAFPLASYAYELCYSAGRGINVVQDTAVISVSDNVLTWRFAGSEQAFKGSYTLTLRLYQNGKLVATVSKRNAFVLDQTKYDGPCDIDLVSFCDNISLQDALLRGNQAMEVARDAQSVAETARTLAGAAVNTAGEAVSTAHEASSVANETKTIADAAMGVANQAKSTAEAAAQTATNVGASLSQKEQELEAALGNLNPDQSEAIALSGKVNDLEREVGEIGTKTDNSFCDLAFGDEEGNDIVRFSEGGVRTKDFDSRSTPSIDTEEDCDLALSDENGKPIVKFIDGGIKTANFDSRILSPKLNGKKLAIIGDSISTYAGFIPSGYVTNYPSGDVDNVNKCYWKIAADRLGMSVNNCAYSGSMASGMSSGDSDNGFAACGDNRIANLGRDGFEPDIVLTYIGINDFNGTSRTLGSWDGTQPIPSDGFITAFTNAYALMISKIQTTYPNARVFCATLMPDNYNDTDGYPSTNSRGEALCLWNDAIRKIANALGCDIVEMAACGINYPNAAENTIEGLHPNAKGMQKMANKLIAELIAKY